MEEIWGCVKYIGIPYDTVIKMTVRQRKEWIRRHNAEQNRLEKDMQKAQKGRSSEVSGEAVNVYAMQQQAMAKATGNPQYS